MVPTHSRRITGVAYELADSLGSKLGPAYQATIIHTPYCKNLEFTRNMPAVSDLVGFANATSRADSDAAKFFFANETRDGKEPVSLEAQAILSVVNGITDAFGKAYNLPAGSHTDHGGSEASPFGNSRPFGQLIARCRLPGTESSALHYPFDVSVPTILHQP